jgi:ABC-type bacteriocin/lantibiotic exporter with double-glycine peptidase domain
MNWQFLIPLLVTTVVAIVGWFIAHRLAAARDRKSKRREQRVQYLVEAFRRLATVGNRPNLPKFADELEAAIADIQLFGTPEQINKVQAFIKEMGEKDKASLNDLLTDLRQDLRKELRLPEVKGKMLWLRVKRK